MQVFRFEEVRLFAFEIHDANEAIFGDQRNSEFGTDVGVGGDITLNLGNVVDQHRLAGESDLPYDSLADGNTHSLRFRRVSDLETHAEFVGAVVQEKDREDAVGDDGT